MGFEPHSEQDGLRVVVRGVCEIRGVSLCDSRCALVPEGGFSHLSRYRHPREIENFDNLAIEAEPTVSKARSDITLRKDGDDTPRDWQLRSPWFYGSKTLWFVKLHRESPSAMATRREYELAFVRDGNGGGHWHLRGFDVDKEVSREFVADLVPSKFSDWMRRQEEAAVPWWEQAA
jgi:hypothetical protein